MRHRGCDAQQCTDTKARKCDTTQLQPVKTIQRLTRNAAEPVTLLFFRASCVIPRHINKLPKLQQAVYSARRSLRRAQVRH